MIGYSDMPVDAFKLTDIMQFMIGNNFASKPKTTTKALRKIRFALGVFLRGKILFNNSLQQFTIA